ncbi:AAA domain-containing protein [Phytomonospora sp. NPDC050363]|uniref:DEAD/DEAH box helicase n=1 Tax=Phytomonospora sp. NPDC050363 TaxID=3155642 RepID=UPI0033C61708
MIRIVLAAIWLDELRRQLKARYDVPTPSASGLRLTAFGDLDKRLARSRLDRGEVRDQIAAGILDITSIDSDNPEHPRFRLTTRRLEVYLHTEPWARDRRRSLTVLDRAVTRGKRRSVDPYAPFLPGLVTIDAPQDTGPCDLATIADGVQRHRLASEAEHALPELQLHPRMQLDLRASARKRFGSLRALLELGAQRAAHGAELSRSGTIVDPGLISGESFTGGLTIELDAPAPFAAESGDTVSLALTGSASSKPHRLQLVQLFDEGAMVTWPDNPRDAARAQREFTVGTRVVLAQTKDFRYQRHYTAVREFLDERNIVGNWAALATLLCEPGRLPRPVTAPPIPATELALNDGQKEAVRTILAAPYACMIQGPPGTGKTQVIAAAVTALVKRGERVLLTAPTHVALDEVLARLLDETDVLPIRRSWRLDLVDERVRHLTEDGYTHELSTGLQTPHNSQMATWRSRLERILLERGALTSWTEAAADGRRSAAMLVVAESQFARNERQRRSDYEAVHRHVAQARASVLTCADHRERYHHEYGTAARDLLAVEGSAGSWIRGIAKLGLGALARARRRSRNLWDQLQRADSRLSQALNDEHRALGIEETTLRRLTADHSTDTALVKRAEKEQTTARASLETAVERLANLGLTPLRKSPEQHGTFLRRLEAEERQLHARIEVQQRWFELAEMRGTDEEADRKSGVKVMGPALVGAVNLVCSTAAGFGGDASFRELDYDTLIVDEASKVTSAEFLIPARRAARWVLVGDERQLRPFVEQTDEHHLHAMAALDFSERTPGLALKEAVNHLSELWRGEDDAEAHQFRDISVEIAAQRLLDGGKWVAAHRAIYSRQFRHINAHDTSPEQALLRAMREHLVVSLFEFCVARAPRELCRALIQQRRMPGELAELVRLPVYQGKYETPKLLPPESQPLVSVTFPHPLTFLDTSAQPKPWHTQDGTTCYNELEAKLVVEVCRAWNRELTKRNATRPLTVSILAFYGAQARLIRRKLGGPNLRAYPRLEFRVIDSVDRIQGQEADLVILSFCRAYRLPRHKEFRPRTALWLQNINRLNVASTRARRALVLVGHAETLRRLREIPAAERYYDNLFGLLESGKGSLLNELDTGAP